MSRRVILIAACAVVLFVLLAAGTVGFLLRTTFTSEAAGQSRNSPDGKWVARALSFQQKTLFGPRRHFSELRIDSAGSSPHTVRRMVIEDTAPTIDWRIEGEVFWKRNSSAVTFKCVTGSANLEVDLVLGR